MVDHDGLAQPLERRPAGRQLPDDHAERPPVAGRRHLARQRLRGRVGQRPRRRREHHALVEDLAQPEVGDRQPHRLGRQDQHVLGLEVPVDDARPVQRRQPGRELRRDLADRALGKRSLLHERPQVAVRRVGGDLVVAPVRVPRLQDAEDVRRVQRGQLRPHLPVGAVPAAEDLRHEVGAPLVPHQQQVRLGALHGQLRDDRVPLAEHGREPDQRVAGLRPLPPRLRRPRGPGTRASRRVVPASRCVSRGGVPPEPGPYWSTGRPV